MTKIQTVAKTHVGRVRDHNEDTFIVGLEPDKFEWVVRSAEVEIGANGAVFVVADGMGGENAGEIASEIAVQSVRAFIHTEAKKGAIENVNTVLESAIIFAHNKIREACKDNPEYIGMGTTITVCMIQGDKIYISWIGDTRAYRFSPHGRVHDLPYHFKNLDILNEDHSKVWQMVNQGILTLEQARTHDESNIITQSLGDLFRTPHPESRVYPLFKDDCIMICSDGLNGMLSDETIESIFSSEQSGLDSMADTLISAANAAGGHDNITLILIKVTEGNPYSKEKIITQSTDKQIKTDVISKRKVNVFPIIMVLLLLAAVSLFYIKKDTFNKYFPWRNLIPGETMRDTLIQTDSTGFLPSPGKDKEDTEKPGKEDNPKKTPVQKSEIEPEKPALKDSLPNANKNSAENPQDTTVKR